MYAGFHTGFGVGREGGGGAEPGGNFTWFVRFRTKGLVVRGLEWRSTGLNFLP